jgi:hypothetical protein
MLDGRTPTGFSVRLKLKTWAGPALVLAAALIFGIWFLPTPYLTPWATDWIFKDSGPFIDGSGHAIQAMFFAQDPWGVPPGRIDSFGGPVGASTILAAVSPIFGFPAKIGRDTSTAVSSYSTCWLAARWSPFGARAPDACPRGA